MIPGSLAACGVAGMALAATFNPFVVARFISSDGQLESQTVSRLFVLDGVAIALGAASLLIARAVREYSVRKARIVIRVLVAMGGIVVMLSLLETALQVANRDGRLIRRQRHYFFQYDARLGWRHRPNSRGTFKERLVAINSMGLRDDEIPRDVPPGQYRVLFLGDSQLFGDGVAIEETFTRLLQKQMPGVRTINAGVIGYGTDQELLYLEEEGYKYHPHLIVVGLNAYDLQDNISDTIRSGYRKPVFLLQQDRLRLTNVPVPKDDFVSRIHKRLSQMSCLYYLLQKKLTVIGRDRRPRWEKTTDIPRVYASPSKMKEAIELTTRILKRMASDGRDWGAAMVVVFLPYQMDFGTDEQYRGNSDRLVQALTDSGRQGGFFVVDMRRDFGKQMSGQLYLDTMHFNPAGHKVVAASLSKHLARLGLIPTQHRGIASDGRNDQESAPTSSNCEGR